MSLSTLAGMLLQKDCDKAQIHGWMRVFRYFYNQVRVHTPLESPPALLPPVDGLSAVKMLTAPIVQEVMKENLS